MLELSINEPEELVKVAHALSTMTRANILRLLMKKSISIIEIAEQLQIPVSTAALNVKVLEEAGLILTELQPASRGAMKVCSRNFDDIHMMLNPSMGFGNANKTYEIEMPIGHFTNFEVYSTCGIANQTGYVIPEDDPLSFYLPECKTAELIWFRQGWIEYRFPKVLPANAAIKSIEFTLELCSEAPNYNNDWPSDITVWVNGVEIATWLSPGDFGDRRGKYNPPWWHDWSTQYGILKAFRVDEFRGTIDNEKASSVTIGDLLLEKKPFVEFKIGVKPDAVNKGGVNLFGRGFGDHPIGIKMLIQYMG